MTYKAHIWYEGISHQYASAGTKVIVICIGQGQIQRLHFSKNGRFGGICVSETHVVFYYFDYFLLSREILTSDDLCQLSRLISNFLMELRTNAKVGKVTKMIFYMYTFRTGGKKNVLFTRDVIF